MEITVRGLWTMIHGMGFGALYLMACSGALVELTGAYVIYPWYRAVPPPGTANLASFPQRLLMSSPSTSAWHSIGMEWKEHVAWLVPISITMAAAVFKRHGRNLKVQPELRMAVLGFMWTSLI